MTSRTYFYRHFASTGVTILLMPEGGDRYKALYGDQFIGSYISAAEAALHVSSGDAFPLPVGVDLATLDIPANLEGWEEKLFIAIERLRPR